MHSYWSRLSQLTSVYVFALLFCGGWTYLGGKLQEWTSAISTIYSDQTPLIHSIAVTRFGTHPLTHSDAALLRVDAEVDLRPQFTWSTNAIYAYISVEYETTYRTRNEVIVWDSIVFAKEDALIRIKNRVSKYVLQDFSKGHMFNNTIHASLHYYQMPKTGFFHKWRIGSDAVFKMPENYTEKGRIRP